MEMIEVSSTFPGITAERLFRAWLDGGEHSAFTGSDAQVEAREGGGFTAWSGYIQGKTLAIEPHRRIVQAWRTTDFPEGSPDSHLEILFHDTEGGAQITLLHSQLPPGQGEEYRKGWEDYYFLPMRVYFSSGKE